MSSLRRATTTQRKHPEWRCVRKTRYQHEAEATEAAATISARYDWPTTAYLCPFCEGWHMGRTSLKQIRKKLNEERETMTESEKQQAHDRLMDMWTDGSLKGQTVICGGVERTVIALYEVSAPGGVILDRPAGNLSNWNVDELTLPETTEN